MGQLSHRSINSLYYIEDCWLYSPGDATDAEIVQESVIKGIQNAMDKGLAGMPESETLDKLKQNLIAESMSTLGLGLESGITNPMTRKPFYPTSHLPSNQGNRGLTLSAGVAVSQLVLKGIAWIGFKLFGGSKMGSSGNRGMNQMMSLKQDSVDVALGHMSKMRNAVSMSPNQPFRSNIIRQSSI